MRLRLEQIRNSFSLFRLPVLVRTPAIARNLADHVWTSKEMNEKLASA